MNIAEATVQELEKNFISYKASGLRNMTQLIREIEDNQKEVEDCQSQGDVAGAAEFQKLIGNCENTLRLQKELFKYGRVPSVADYEYRHKQYNTFAQRIGSLVSAGEMLCFHGTSIIATKHILESGNINSGASRGDYRTSLDAATISVTDIRNVKVSVESYMNLTDDMYQPAGCLFIIRAADDKDYKNAVERMSIKNVDFKHNPDRLVAIITTPENLERVSEWAKKGNIAPAKVVSLEGFISRYPILRRRRARERETMTPEPQEINLEFPRKQKYDNRKRENDGGASFCHRRCRTDE